MMTRRRHRILSRIVLGLALAAFAVPPAQAMIPHEGGGAVDVAVVRPDDRPLRPTAVTMSQPALGQAEPGGLNWDDVGIGAGMALGTVLLAGLGAGAIRSRRKVAHSSEA